MAIKNDHICGLLVKKTTYTHCTLHTLTTYTHYTLWFQKKTIYIRTEISFNTFCEEDITFVEPTEFTFHDSMTVYCFHTVMFNAVW